jgi:hypothetical protein
MSENKYFIFKTALPTPTYIGYDSNPGENSVAHGIKFTEELGKPEGHILYNGLDENDCKLLIIENPKSNIKTIKEFDSNYSKFTRGVKLIMTSNAFSECVKDAINASHSGKTTSDKTSSTKAKKASGKKPSKKGGVKKHSTSKHNKSHSDHDNNSHSDHDDVSLTDFTMGGKRKKGSKKKSSRKGGCWLNERKGGKKKSSKKSGKRGSKKKSSRKGGCGCALVGGKKKSKKGSKKSKK